MLAFIIILLFAPSCIWRRNCDLSFLVHIPTFEAYIFNRFNLLNMWSAQWVTLPDQSVASANAKNKLILWLHSCVTVTNKSKACPFHSTTASIIVQFFPLGYTRLTCAIGWKQSIFFVLFYLTEFHVQPSVYQLIFLRLKCSEMEAEQSCHR